MKVAVVQPRRSVEDHRENIERAAEITAKYTPEVDLLMFPEGFPGPWWLQPDEKIGDAVKGGVEESEALAAIMEAIRGDAAVGFGLNEKLEGRYYNSYVLADRRGVLGVYRKMLPAVFELNAPIPISQASEPLIVEMKDVKVGVSICWEALFPEIPRRIALMGAEVLLFPTGGVLHELRESWRSVWIARAVENLAYVLANVSIYSDEEGAAVIAVPEGVIAETTQEGVITARLDMARIRWLREIDEELTIPKKYRVVPGLLRWARRIPRV